MTAWYLALTEITSASTTKCPRPDENGNCPVGYAYAELDQRCAPIERICSGRAWRCNKKHHPRFVCFADGTPHCCRPLGHIPKRGAPGRGLCHRWEPSRYCK